MPVDAGVSKDGIVFQREQYAKGGLSRRYWDYKDAEIIKSIGGGRVIADIGCGEGILLEKLAKALPDREISGVDIDPLNVEICRRHGLKVFQGGIYELPFKSSSLDVCLFIEVIEHLSEPGRALDELSRVLKPGGRLLVMFPNDFTFKAARIAMLMFKEAFYDTGHLRQWTPGAMKKELLERGFRTIGQKNLPLPFFFMGLHHLAAAEKRI